MPHQQYIADVALELDEDGQLFYTEVDLLLGRQEGKTELKFVVMVLRLTAMVHRLGPQRVTFTMQNRKKARARLERDYATRLRGGAGFVEIDPRSRERPSRLTEWRLGMNSGVEAIQFGRDSWMQIDTPSREDGHGDTLDAGFIDEAFAHVDSTVELGMEPAMLTSESAQLWVLSAAGDAQSKYLWRKVLRGRKLIESGVEARVAYFEWSGEYGVDDPSNPALWASCCPALGYTVPVGKIEALWTKAVEGGQVAIDDFCRSYLCMWPEVPVLDEVTKGSVLGSDQWLRLADPAAERGGQVVFGVDVDVDRLAHIAVAWRRPDGLIQVMLADSGVSPLRTPARLRDLEGKWNGPVMLGGPAASLEAEVKNASVVSSGEFAAAFGGFEDLVSEGEIRHGNQPELNEAVAKGHTRAYGTAGDRTLQMRDNPEVGPLVAVIRALHGLRSGAAVSPATPKIERKQTARSETADLATMQF